MALTGIEPCEILYTFPPDSEDILEKEAETLFHLVSHVECAMFGVGFVGRVGHRGHFPWDSGQGCPVHDVAGLTTCRSCSCGIHFCRFGRPD